MESARKLLGTNLKRLRISRDMTQLQLAERADLSPKMIQKLEYCESAASPETLDKISRALQVPVESLFEDPKRPASRRPPRDEISWPELTRLMQGYLASSHERRLLALYMLTNDEVYLDQFEKIPSAAPIAKVLKKVL